ncbi:MAG: hypothetical protein JWR48_1892 [Mycobacterium sp.]|jgi:hypothetical protein|nr:hypothetical protein [Mycobacterium sp.]
MTENRPDPPGRCRTDLAAKCVVTHGRMSNDRHCRERPLGNPLFAGWSPAGLTIFQLVKSGRMGRRFGFSPSRRGVVAARGRVATRVLAKLRIRAKRGAVVSRSDLDFDEYVRGELLGVGTGQVGVAHGGGYWDFLVGREAAPHADHNIDARAEDLLA